MLSNIKLSDWFCEKNPKSSSDQVISLNKIIFFITYGAKISNFKFGEIVRKLYRTCRTSKMDLDRIPALYLGISLGCYTGSRNSKTSYKIYFIHS